MVRRRLAILAAVLAAAALAAALLPGPAPAQTTTRVFDLFNAGATTDSGGYIMVGSEGQGVLSCDGAYPIYGSHKAAQVITRQPTPGTFLIRVLNGEGVPVANYGVRLNCVEDMVFTEPERAGQGLHFSTPTPAQVKALGGRQ